MKNNYVVQIKYVGPRGDLCSWENVVLGPVKASRSALINGVIKLICEKEKCRPRDITIRPSTLLYSVMEAL